MRKSQDQSQNFLKKNNLKSDLWKISEKSQNYSEKSQNHSKLPELLSMQINNQASPLKKTELLLKAEKEVRIGKNSKSDNMPELHLKSQNHSEKNQNCSEETQNYCEKSQNF